MNAKELLIITPSILLIVYMIYMVVDYTLWLRKHKKSIKKFHEELEEKKWLGVGVDEGRGDDETVVGWFIYDYDKKTETWIPNQQIYNEKK